METIFPFGFPWPTSFYMTLYLVTLVIHAMFMNYVVAGTALLVVLPLQKSVAAERILSVLRDWMPFVLSAAITAGVAPLLFLQILYKRNFYTANLLLFHRWMAIVPALIAGFYLLYLLKTKTVQSMPVWLASLVALAAFACFGFIGSSWTENHLLSLETQSAWSAHYAEGRMHYASSQTMPRLATWFCGSFVTLSVLLTWQFRDDSTDDSEVRRWLSRMALAAAILTAGLGSIWLATLEAGTRELLMSSFSMAWIVGLGVASFAVVALMWFGERSATGIPLWATSFALIAALACLSVARETIRLSKIDVTRFFDAHAKASGVGGFVAFLIFAAINAGLIAYCISLVRRSEGNSGAAS